MASASKQLLTHDWSTTLYASFQILVAIRRNMCVLCLEVYLKTVYCNDFKILINQQVRKSTHSVTILFFLQNLTFYLSGVMRVMPELSEGLGIPQKTKVTNVTAVTKIAWGFPTQSHSCAETHIDRHTKYPLLSDFNQN